ncbi:MAG TPA: efflux RND transporter periplasmic adaptor subunit [Thermoanaerobaculaceae bacterium]|nr:efflux RND transporter periplasmic adaptor subunit [Thermoanaerobaculaceae bacterium]
MRRWLVLLGIVAIMGGVLGRVLWRSWRGHEVTLAAIGTGRVVAAVYATGRVDCDDRATLRARVAAPLTALLVGSGQAVTSGEVVARQDASALHLATERAVGELEAARATFAQAQDEAARSEKLVHDGLLSEDAWVKAREKARELAAQSAAMETAVRIAREQESWTELRSPLAGTVTAIAHRAGDPLREGDEVLTVVNLSNAYVRVGVDERDAGRVAVGQQVRMVFDAYPGRLLLGTVWRLVPAVDRLTKSTDVLVSLPPDRPPLQLDFTVTVNIVTGTVESALVVPRDALDGSGAQRTAFVARVDGRVERRALELGPCDEERCQVLAGLTKGDRVVSPLPTGLKDGDRIVVVPTRAAGHR